MELTIAMLLLSLWWSGPSIRGMLALQGPGIQETHGLWSAGQKAVGPHPFPHLSSTSTAGGREERELGDSSCILYLLGKKKKKEGEMDL